MLLKLQYFSVTIEKKQEQYMNNSEALANQLIQHLPDFFWSGSMINLLFCFTEQQFLEALQIEKLTKCLQILDLPPVWVQPKLDLNKSIVFAIFAAKKTKNK